MLEADFGAVFSLLQHDGSIESRRQFDLAIAFRGSDLTIQAFSCRMQALGDLPDCRSSVTTTTTYSLAFANSTSGQTKTHLVVELIDFGIADLTWWFKLGEPQRGLPLGGTLLCDDLKRGRVAAISSSNLDGWAWIEGTINGVSVHSFPDSNCAGVGLDAQIMWVAPLA